MKAIDAAKYIINKAIDNNNPVSNLQLQKILYFAQEDNNAELLKDDFQAWDFGPVIPGVYHEFKDNGANTIKRKQEQVEVSKADRKKLDKTYDSLKGYTAGRLVTRAHEKNRAWDRVYEKGNNNTIAKAEIKKDYIDKHKDSKDK